MKSKGVTTQTKAFNEYFLMVVFTLLLNRAHVCLFVCLFFKLDRNITVKVLNTVVIVTQ